MNPSDEASLGEVLKLSTHPTRVIYDALGNPGSHPMAEWLNGGVKRVQDSISLLGEALQALGDRPGERAAATRASLQAQKDELATVLSTVESVGMDLTGPLALELLAEIARIRADFAAAEQAILKADRHSVIARIQDRDLITADARELVRRFETVRKALKYPRQLPAASDFAAARQSTLSFAARPGKRPGVLDQHEALDAGRDSSPEVARWWIVYEPAEPHALLALRSERFAARGT